jgi:hypothetical protein
MKGCLYSLVALAVLLAPAAEGKADYAFTTLDPPGTTFVTAFATPARLWGGTLTLAA